MAANIERLSCFSDMPAPTRRKAHRRLVDATVTVLTASGDEAAARVGDASTHGCSLTVDAGWLRNGRFVTLLLDDAEPLQAIVRWVRDGRAGLEFLRPLPAGSGAWQDLADSGWGA